MIEWKLKVVMAERDMTVKRLSDLTGMAASHLSNLRNYPPKRLEMETLDRLCWALNCKPGDLLRHS